MWGSTGNPSVKNKISASRRNVMRSSAYTLFFVALVVGIACPRSAPAQTFKQVKVKGGAALTQIAAGGASVWALASNRHPYIYKSPQFVLANSISLSKIVVGGGDVHQADAVWGLDSSGSIYSATKSGTSWVFSKVPGVLDFIAVGSGYNDSCHPYEVWGLQAASIYRYNFCIKDWENVPGSLNTLTVGGGEIWGINANTTLFRFNLNTLLFDQSFGDNFVQIAVGPNGVWANIAHSLLVVFDYSSGVFNFGAGISATQIQAGGNGTWGIDDSQQIFRLWPSTAPSFFPGTPLVSISVGSGGGVWGLDSSGKAYVFSTP
jgi:hypothetical protein